MNTLDHFDGPDGIDTVGGTTSTSIRSRTSRVSLHGLRRRVATEQGLTTAEYAVGTVAAAGLGGVLIKLLTSDTVRNLLWELLRKALDTMTF